MNTKNRSIFYYIGKPFFLILLIIEGIFRFLYDIAFIKNSIRQVFYVEMLWEWMGIPVRDNNSSIHVETDKYHLFLEYNHVTRILVVISNDAETVDQTREFLKDSLSESDYIRRHEWRANYMSDDMKLFRNCQHIKVRRFPARIWDLMVAKIPTADSKNNKFNPQLN